MSVLKTAWANLQDGLGNRFSWSHVKAIFYNYAEQKLLSTKLDEIDALIDQKIAKAMMSNVQVNDQNKVPTSALAYAMQQQITENEEAITGLNSDLKGFKFSKSLDVDSMTTFSCNLQPGFALVWGGIRSGGTEDNEGLFFILVDSTQGKFSYTPILTGEIESVEWLNSQLTITFARASYWQINAIYVDSVG